MGEKDFEEGQRLANSTPTPKPVKKPQARRRKRVPACQSLFDSPGCNKRARFTSTPQPKSTSANDHQNGHNDDDEEDSVVENSVVESLHLGLEATVNESTVDATVNESTVDATVNESTVNESVQDTDEHPDLFDKFNTIWSDAFTNFKKNFKDAVVKNDKTASKLQEHYGLLKSENTEEKIIKGETLSEVVRTVLQDYIRV